MSRDALHNLCLADPVWAERYDGWSALGHGGSASVVRTRSRATGEDVALKIFPRLNTDEWKRYTLEVRNAQRLTSPYIVRSYSAFPRESFAWIEMEWVDGPNLRQEIERLAPDALPLERAVEIAAAVATALAAAHAESVIHRDVKPANILLPTAGRPVAKLGDFGLSRLADATRLTQSGLLVGTPQFAAPEVIEGRAADGSADVYALSLCLYLMLSGGRAPFDIEDATTPTQWIWAHTTVQPRDIDLVNPNVPEVVAELLRRGLDKEPELRPTAAEFLRALPTSAPKDSTPVLPWTRPLSLRGRARRTQALAGVALVGGLGLGALTVGLTRGPAAPPSLALTRLTADAGLTVNPALSPDGKFLAYASDRAGNGNLDIWIQQAVGGQPLQLTHDEADDHEPSFSPDGTKIVFRSERAGGGVYVVPALGGEARFLVPQGHRPSFSPDGTQVACLLGAARIEARPLGTVAIVPAAGGAPQRFPLVRDVTGPIWAPDGTHLLVVGNLDMIESADDWWVMPTEAGRPPIRTGALAVFQRSGLFTLDRSGGPDSFPRPFQWVGNRVLFSAKLGDSTNVWEIEISPKTFKVTGAPRRLTMGTEIESEPVLAPDGRIVFSAERSSIDLWALAADTVQGKVLSEPRRLTDDPAVESLPNLSGDGKRLLYLSTRLGTPDVWLKDIEAHTDQALTATADEETMPVLSRDGSHAFYGVFAGKRKMAIETVSTAGNGVPQRICEDCGVPTDESRDGRFVVLQYRPAWSQVGDVPPKLGRTSLAVLDRQTGQRVEILKHPNFNVYRGQLSPDGKWIAFHGEHVAADTREFIAPFRGAAPIGEGDWITVVNGAFFNDAPQWSPDGNLLYYFSDRDGFRCIWAQPLDPNTKAPVGGPIAVYHAHHRRPSVTGVGLGSLGVAVARDRIVFNMMERWANIWSVDSVRR